MSPNPILTRRRLLGCLGLGGAALLLRDFLPSLALATDFSSDPVYFLLCTFEGGWDQMLALDPRDNTKYSSSEGSIFPAYDVLADSDAEIASILETNPSGIVVPVGSSLSFGPAVGRLAEGDLCQDLCIVRGINMGTLTHEVGRRYFLTGKFPRGLSASGSAIPTVVAAQEGDLTVIPNLVVGLETYNEGLDTFASGLSVRSSSDIQTVLTPLGEALPDEVSAAINSYLWPAEARCIDQKLDGNGMVSQFLASRSKALEMVKRQLGSLFAFTTTPSAELEALYSAFNISTTSSATASAQLAGPAGQAMIAAQAITNGISQAVSFKLASSIDHHDDDYLTDHSTALREGFNALADLINYLKRVTHPTTGKTYWDHTVLLCTSDFARTPTLNNRDGRDHHLASSCLVAGRGIKGNQVIGGTEEETLTLQGIDLETGQVVGANGWTVRPPDVHATLLEAMGLSWEHLANQDPVLIGAMLK